MIETKENSAYVPTYLCKNTYQYILMISIHEDLPYNLNLLLSNHKHVFLPNILAYHGMKLEKDYCLFCDYLQAAPDYYMVLDLKKNYDLKKNFFLEK